MNDEDTVAKLHALADELESEGLDVSSLRALEHEIAAAEAPPTVLGRLMHRTRTSIAHHWGHAVAEVRQSRQVMQLIGVSVRGERELSEEERAAIREQLLDVFRMVPAGVLVGTNAVLPVPGTSLVTPWVLLKLGLLPSRWREAYLLDRLRRQHEQLSAGGNHDAAARLRGLHDQVERDAIRRDSVRSDAGLLTHWDQNENGRWDDDEREAYLAELFRMRGLVSSHWSAKRWFVDYQHEVFGAVRLSELAEHVPPEQDMLVCFDGQSGWVSLRHLLGANPVLV